MSLLSSIRTATAAFNGATQTRSAQETAPHGGWLRNAWSSLTGGMPTRAQADVALHNVAAQINAKQQAALAVDILIPSDRTSLTDYEIRSALVKRVLEEAGVQPSRAAVEEVVGHLTEHYYAAAGDTLHQRVSPGKPQAAFINGHKARVYRMQIEAQSRTDILKLKGFAEQVTQAGTRAVHDQTPAERWNRVKQIYNEKYADASTSHALADIFSLKNIGLLAGAEAALATPAAPFVIASGGSMLLIEEAKAHATALEIKQLTYAPQKPSDLDIAAQKLAQLATQGKVIAGTAVLGGVASAGSRIGARMTDGIVKPPLEMPEAITPEGVRVRVPQTEELLVSTQAEMRGRGTGGGASFEKATLTKVEAQYPRGFKADEAMQRQGISNQPAADYVGYKAVKGGYIAEITEITVKNKSFSELGKQFEGAQKLVTREFGDAPVRREYVVRTNNRQLVDALAKVGNRLSIGGGKPKEVIVIYEGGGKR